MKTVTLLNMAGGVFLLLCHGAYAQTQQWGFSTASGDYLSLERNPVGQLSGVLLRPVEDGGFSSFDVTGLNVVSGQMSLSIPELADTEIELTRSAVNSNTVWIDEATTGLFSSPLMGVTRREDPYAVESLARWQGDRSILTSLDDYVSLRDFAAEVLGPETEPPESNYASLVVPRTTVPLWEVMSQQIDVPAQVRTLDRDTAIVAVPPDVVASALRDSTTRSIIRASDPTGTQVEALRDNYLVVPSISLFDRFGDMSIADEELDRQLSALLVNISQLDGCQLRRANAAKGSIWCTYHSSEYGERTGVWLRTGIAFSIVPAENGVGMEWRSKTWFAARPANQRPSAGEMINEVGPRTDIVVTNVVKTMMDRFQTSLTRRRAPTE